MLLSPIAAQENLTASTAPCIVSFTLSLLHPSSHQRRISNGVERHQFAAAGAACFGFRKFAKLEEVTRSYLDVRAARFHARVEFLSPVSAAPALPAQPPLVHVPMDSPQTLRPRHGVAPADETSGLQLRKGGTGGIAPGAAGEGTAEAGGDPLLAAAYETGLLADVTLVSADKERLPAHRLVLALVSPALRAMLTGGRPQARLIRDIDCKASNSRTL